MSYLRFYLFNQVVCLCLQCVLTMLVVTLCVCEWLGRWAFIVWVCGIFLTMCGVFTMIPTMLISAFGTAHYNAIQGMIDFAGVSITRCQSLVDQH
jgi:hypothetical protein